MNSSRQQDFTPQPDRSVSETVQQVSAGLERSLPSPQAGQLWRASWNEDLVLCLIIDVDDDHRVEVAPVALDDEIGDVYSITIDRSVSPLQVSTTVLAGMCISLKEYVLDAYFGDIDGGLLQLAQNIRSNNLAGRRPGSLGDWAALVRLGDPDAGPLDEKRDFRLEVSHQMSRIAAADFLPEAPNRSTTLHEIFRSSGVNLTDLRQTLNISLSEARAIDRGAAPLEPHQTELLANLPGLSSDTLAQAMPRLSPSYLSAVQRPTVSRLIRREAQQKQVHPRSVVQSLPGKIAARRQHSYDSSGRVLSSEEKYWIDAITNLLSDEET